MLRVEQGRQGQERCRAEAEGRWRLELLAIVAVIKAHAADASLRVVHGVAIYRCHLCASPTH